MSTTTIKTSTHRAMRRAVQWAKRDGLTWPTLDTCHRAASLHGADVDSVACAFGYMPAIDPATAESMDLPRQRHWYINAREWIVGDERVGVLPNAEAVVLFARFLEVTGCPVQPLVLAMTPQLFDPAAADGNPAVADAAC